MTVSDGESCWSSKPSSEYLIFSYAGSDDRTCLRLVIIGITRRPVLNPPAPQREFDITSLPDIVGEVSGLSATLSAGSSSKAAVESIAPGAPLRSHLYPMAGSLPDSHLPHPLSLLPELSASAFASELLTSTATLAHLLLLLRAQVSPQFPLPLQVVS
jgi:peroxin-16